MLATPLPQVPFLLAFPLSNMPFTFQSHGTYKPCSVDEGTAWLADWVPSPSDWKKREIAHGTYKPCSVDEGTAWLADWVPSPSAISLRVGLADQLSGPAPPLPPLPPC